MDRASLPGEPSEWRRVVCRVSRKELVHVQFIIESYEGLAVMSTVDPSVAVVSIAFPAAQEPEVRGLLAALNAEAGIEIMEEPDAEKS